MTSDQELVLIFGGLHLVSLLFGGVLFVMFLRSDTTTEWRPPSDDDSDDGGGGGGNDRLGVGPKPRPTGGIPLPDAQPSDVRLRGHESLRERKAAPERRPAREPAPVPRRVPARE